MENQQKITVVSLFFFFWVVSVHAQEYYRVVEISGKIMSGGKTIQVGDLYRKGQKIDWPYGRPWLRVTRDGQNYKVTREGIKRSQMSTSRRVQPTTLRYLIHRGWDTKVSDSVLHYSQQRYYLLGKNDFLYFERPSSETDVLIEAIWTYEGIQQIVPIECTENGKNYIITPKVFNNKKKVDSIRITIRETTRQGIIYAYNHGLEIIYIK